MSTDAKQYKVIVGLSWYDDGRAEPGEVRDDIPKESLEWLLEQGMIEVYKAPKASKTKEAADGA